MSPIVILTLVLAAAFVKILDKRKFWHYQSLLLNKIQYQGEWTFSVEKSFILDPKISVGAKAVYLALKSYCSPGDPTAFPSADSLCQNLALSRNTLHKYQRELRDHGLLSRRQTNENQCFGPVVYTLFTPNSAPRKLCATQNLLTEEVPRGREDLPKGKETTKEKAAKQMVAVAEGIYAEYPRCRRVSKTKTLGYIIRALLRGNSKSFLLERTKAFAEAVANEEKRYIPMSTTWFNQERFADDPDTWGNGHEVKSEPHKEGDPAGTINGKTAVWTKVSNGWMRTTR